MKLDLTMTNVVAILVNSQVQFQGSTKLGKAGEYQYLNLLVSTASLNRSNIRKEIQELSERGARSYGAGLVIRADSEESPKSEIELSSDLIERTGASV